MSQNKNKPTEGSIELLLKTQIFPESEGQNNGKITIDILRGNSPFKYQWDDGPTSQNRINLEAGRYSVTINHGKAKTTLDFEIGLVKSKRNKTK